MQMFFGQICHVLFTRTLTDWEPLQRFQVSWAYLELLPSCVHVVMSTPPETLTFWRPNHALHILTGTRHVEHCWRVSMLSKQWRCFVNKTSSCEVCCDCVFPLGESIEKWNHSALDTCIQMSWSHPGVDCGLQSGKYGSTFLEKKKPLDATENNFLRQ